MTKGVLVSPFWWWIARAMVLLPVPLSPPKKIATLRVRKRSNRPLLMNDDPEGTMRRLIDERYPIYALADIRIRSRDVAHEVVADEVLQALVARIAPAETRETGAS